MVLYSFSQLGFVRKHLFVIIQFISKAIGLCIFQPYVSALPGDIDFTSE